LNREEKTKLLYVTAGSITEADKIATRLVEEKLVACANILGTSTAIYQWEGKLTKEKGVILILKTTAKLVQKSVKRIIGLHSYECPAVIVLDIQDGNKEFLSWINNVTNPNYEG
jgi:periplasmic divalent cation tolerance protein